MDAIIANKLWDMASGESDRKKKQKQQQRRMREMYYAPPSSGSVGVTNVSSSPRGVNTNLDTRANVDVSTVTE